MDKGYIVLFPNEVERIEGKETKDYTGKYDKYQYKIHLKNAINKPRQRTYRISIVGEIELIGYLCEDGKTIVEY